MVKEKCHEETDPPITGSLDDVLRLGPGYKADRDAYTSYPIKD
jgi:hypothetical protein